MILIILISDDFMMITIFSGANCGTFHWSTQCQMHLWQCWWCCCWWKWEQGCDDDDDDAFDDNDDDNEDFRRANDEISRWSPPNVGSALVTAVAPVTPNYLNISWSGWSSSWQSWWSWWSWYCWGWRWLSHCCVLPDLMIAPSPADNSAISRQIRPAPEHQPLQVHYMLHQVHLNTKSNTSHTTSTKARLSIAPEPGTRYN